MRHLPSREIDSRQAPVLTWPIITGIHMLSEGAPGISTTLLATVFTPISIYSRSPFYYYEVTLASTANTSFRPETSVTNSESPETPP